MKLFRSSILQGMGFAGALASAAIAHAASPATSTSDGSIAQVNRGLLTPGAYAAVSSADDLRYRTDGVSSSTDAVDAEMASLAGPSASAAEGAGAGQYGARRRRSYGRSRYEDRMHNADGSTKIAFVGGGGMNVPVGNTGKFYTPSYDIEVGAGYNWSRMFGVLAEVHYDHAGVTGGAINYEYNNLIAAGLTSDQLAGFDANSHVFSFSLNPVISFSDKQNPLGAYVTGGVGYARKTTNFTIPAVGTACNYYYCYQYGTNANLDTASAGSLATNLGFGLTYRISEFSNERLFIEARYHWLKIDSSNNQDFFPFNRRNSEYIPVLVGIRF